MTVPLLPKAGYWGLELPNGQVKVVSEVLLAALEVSPDVLVFGKFAIPVPALVKRCRLS